jgi:type II secretory pathway component PulL
MAKKSRRAKAKHRARVEKAAQERRLQQPAPVSAEVQSPTPVSPTVQAPKAQTTKVQAPKVQDLASRYQYVIPEIKRIGIIAGAIILVLIILSFVLG